MKVGSLVEYIKDEDPPIIPYGYNPCSNLHMVGEQFIVDGFYTDEHSQVWVIFYGNPLMGYWLDNVREIEFPPELEEQINQSLHQTVEI